MAAFSHPDHLDLLDIEILNKRKAFCLPPKSICDELVDIFFRWIVPVLPVVDKHGFMRKYNDPEESPSILLLQAMFMIASRFSGPKQHSDDSQSTPRVFYKKTKALYDAGYETNPITVIQAVVLMGLYWDGPDGEISFYFSFYFFHCIDP